MSDSNAKSQLARDALELAGGSGIVLLSGLCNRGLRLLTTWFLSGVLGAALFGEYVYIVMVVTIISSFAPLGVDVGVLMFGARHLRSDAPARLKGLLLTSTTVVLCAGLLAAISLFVLSRWGPLAARPEAVGMQIASATIALLAPLYVALGALRAAKDMRSSSIALHLVLPIGLLGGALGAVGLGAGLYGVLGTVVVAHGVALIVALVFCWRRYGPLLTNRAITAMSNTRELLSYSIPQSLALMTNRIAQWSDILMLTWLSTSAEVGMYRVAVALAAVGLLPVFAIKSMFSPMIAEQVHAGELDRLDALLKMVTRGLMAFALPAYLFLFLVPDLALLPFDEVYRGSAVPLMILAAGQLIRTACAPATNLIPMAGYARLNLANSAAAGALNVLLNWLLIPRYGAEGAAMATGITLAVWSLWRVVEIRLLLRCFPWSFRSLVPMGFLLISGGVAATCLSGHALVWRLFSASAITLVFGALVWKLRLPEDGIFWLRIKTAVQQKLASRTRSA